MCVCAVVQSCPALCDPMDRPHWAPLSMKLSRQEYWSGLPLPTPGDLPDPGTEPVSFASPAPAGRVFTSVTKLKQSQKPKVFVFWLHPTYLLHSSHYKQGGEFSSTFTLSCGYSFQFPDMNSPMLCKLMPKMVNYKATLQVQILVLLSTRCVLSRKWERLKYFRHLDLQGPTL